MLERPVAVANHKHIVNELSGTIDLESTLIRAEALFRRFHRLVDAVDKKENFPAPRRNTGPSSDAPTSPTAGGSTVSGPALPPSSKSNTTSPAKPADADGAKKIITPELRKLLSRKVEILPRKDVVGKGDGFVRK